MSWEYEILFDAEKETEPRLWSTEASRIPVGRMGYRVRTIKAGPRLEAEIYPVFGREQEKAARRAKANATIEAQRRLNLERAKRYMVQLADANFTAEDISLTLTYAGTPPEYNRALKDVKNFLNKTKRLRAKRKLSELKYIYTVEGNEDGEKRRIHVHMLMSGGIGREELETLWAKGYANADRLQPNENGLEGIARYMMKQQRNRRRWACSRNLKRPKTRTRDCKISNSRVKHIAYDFDNDAKQIMEKLYQRYHFVSSRVFYSDVVDGVYIRCVMREKTKG